MAEGRVLLTGSAGFIGGYLAQDLLKRGYEVVGIDDYSKYGRVSKSYDGNAAYTLIEADASAPDVVRRALDGCDYFIAGAAKIGGISYFHTFPYDLLAANERITATACDAAIEAHTAGTLRRAVFVSSSMVFESANIWPSYEGQERAIPPPVSSYGFQKLAVEYWARAAHEQYGLPYTIVRPFNCVGTGEGRALNAPEILSGNVRLAMSHVVPDLVQKVLQGQDPLHLLGDGTQIRHFTYGGDIAAGIVTAMEHPAALNEDFNISTAESTTIVDLAQLIWRKVRGSTDAFRVVHDEPFPHDVRRRVPATEKAERLLGFRAEVPLDQALDEVIPWVEEGLERGWI